MKSPPEPPQASGTEIDLGDNERVRTLCGGHNENLKLLEARTGARLGSRGTRIVVGGADEERRLAERVVRELYGLVAGGYALQPEDVDQAARLLKLRPDLRLADIFLDTIYVSSRNRSIAPKGPAQKEYVQAIRRHDIVFGIGPAGTGKTYLAMAMAVAWLAERRVKRIVLCRPAVEAGERLGFLPGDIAEKVNPYLRPLYDALHDMMEYDKAVQLIERGTVEVAPLAFMRGRTLNDAFVILDEAQNTTSDQMKMFLTRLGYGSKAVVTGDVTQTDLPPGQASGLSEAVGILRRVPGIAFCTFTEVDVVRHPLVQEVIRAYERGAGPPEPRPA